MINEFHYDGGGNMYKTYDLGPLRWGKEDTTVSNSSLEAGLKLDEMAKVYMESTDTKDYEKALTQAMKEAPELTKIYATGPIIRPSGDATPHLKSISSEVDRRTKKYLREHELNPISDYDIALQIILNEDPELKEQYANGGFNLWEN